MRKYTYLSLALIFLLMAITGILNANNISISNPVLTGKNTGSHYIMVQFDISWENSWRTSSAPNNWDAAWVLVKYRIAGGAWQHAWLNDVGHTAPSGSIIDVGLLTPAQRLTLRPTLALAHSSAVAPVVPAHFPKSVFNSAGIMVPMALPIMPWLTSGCLPSKWCM